MEKQDLLFYNEYEQFYIMAKESKAFRIFCQKAFGRDFSQDGFSDVSQVDRALEYIPKGGHVLDIGCGNGKMLKYLQGKCGCSICGFDYSKNAIEVAKQTAGPNDDFREGAIGEVTYPKNYFDVIISMDTMYFAKDMSAFVGQMMKWLKADGTIFIAYQEGDVMPKTQNEHTTVLAEAFKSNGIEYRVTNITKQTYEMLKKKREAAILHQDEFIEEGNKEWLDMLMWQTECTTADYEQFASEMSRYIYIVKNKASRIN